MSLRIKSRITIIGAGFAGISIAKEIRLKGIFGRVVAFLDDDPSKIGKHVDGVPILGPIEDAVRLMKPTTDDEALIAIPSGTKEQILRIYNLLKGLEFPRIRILPGISQILFGDVHLVQTRDLDPQDLLSRTPVRVPLKQSLAYVRNKRVLITGAGGSIGSELARQLLSGGAQRLYLFGHGENSIYGIDRELKLLQDEGVGEKATVVPIIGELQDRDFIIHLLKRVNADVIFHAAAHKHVPLTEANPVEAIKNNVFGTANLLDAADAGGVDRLVMISSDKAVEPRCIYGASKSIAEELVLLARRNGHRYSVVRFGNVLGSRGSIVPLFRSQIEKGGPVTLTHPKARRFFMTIPEASSLVLKAGGIDEDGELLLLDMGEPLVIKDLAEQMIRFYGYNPGTDIPVSYIGLKSGEKLVEKLWSEREEPEETEHPRIIRLKRDRVVGSRLRGLLKELRPICFWDPALPAHFRNRRLMRNILRNFLPSLNEAPDEPEY
jgi:FlaA1/EpsC-like NDP-sugar epimerase